MSKHKGIQRVTGLLMVGLLASQPILNVTATSKTPILGEELEQTAPRAEPFSTPENYPQELIDHYEENMDARSYIAVDAETNRVLAQKEGNTPYPIASMSKVISIYLVYKAIDEGTLSMDQEITVPQEIEDDIAFNENLSNIGLLGGVAYPVEDLIYAVMLESANDATSALMWEIYGSEEAAVEAIMAQLNEWGITSAQFYSTSGAPNNELPESLWVAGSNAESENVMSAADVALMSQRAIEAYPEILDVSATSEYVFMEGTDEEKTIVNPNLLLPGRTYGREGNNGLKSGFTDAAGRNFVATTTENGRLIISVVMGIFGEDPTSGEPLTAYWDQEILLDGLAEYPDLYQNESLPTNLPPEPEVEETEAEDGEEVDEENSEQTLENNRDNPLTNFMRKIFSVFN